MDLFTDCEIQRMHLRGNTVVLIVGDRKATPREGDELLKQYAASFGRSTAAPAYISKDGWQLLIPRIEPQTSPANLGSPGADDSETKPAEPASNTLESATQAPESESKPAESESRPVIHAQHSKKGGR